MSERQRASASSSSALLELRGEVRALVAQVERLAARVAVLEADRSPSGYSVVSAPVPVEIPVDQQSSAAPSVASGVSVPSAAGLAQQLPRGVSIAPQSWEERERIAGEIGLFLRRAVEGEHRGPSGRDQIRLASRYYIVCKTFQGQVHTDPVLLFTRFADVKAHCYRGSWGDSVFVGLPSQREITVCLRVAGFSAPPP